MAQRLANSERAKQKEALEHSFASTLETITDLPQEEVKRLAKKFRDKTATAVSRHSNSQAQITIKPKNQSRIVFEIQEKNCTRTPREIVEDWLDRHDRGGQWGIKRKTKKGSKLTVVATRGRAVSNEGRKVSDNGSVESEEEDVDQLKEKLSGLDESQKETIADMLD